MSETKTFGVILHTWSKEEGHKDRKVSVQAITLHDALRMVEKHFSDKGYRYTLKSWEEI